ncbi:MAG: GNAT family N-acetyltransferase [Burkholderiales bacterium]
MELAYATHDEPPPEMALEVDRGLDAHNVSAAPLDGVRPLAVFATGASGRIVGGAVGRTWGECCELLQLWVDDGFRRSGVGSELMRRFEARGRERECSVFYLTTLSFQAPGFYERHGYGTLAVISGYPDGIRKFLMQKIVGERPP